MTDSTADIPDIDPEAAQAAADATRAEAMRLWTEWGPLLAEHAEPLLRALANLNPDAQEVSREAFFPPLIDRLRRIVSGEREDEGIGHEMVDMHNLIDDLLEEAPPVEGAAEDAPPAMMCQILIAGSNGHWFSGPLARAEHQNVMKMLIVGKDGKDNKALVELFVPISAITGIMVPRAIDVAKPKTVIYTGGNS